MSLLIMSAGKFPYKSADYETVPCNLCSGTSFEVLGRRDRNGLPVQTCICKRCGLIFINPRMTAHWYGKFYEREYREQLARFKVEPVQQPDYPALFERTRKHGVALAQHLKDSLLPGLTLEAGSSVGGVLRGFQEVLGCETLGIEPSPGESGYANEVGIRTFTTTIENFKEEIPPAANIICTQSLNHFLDPRWFFQWSHQHLQPAGRLVLEVMNFRHAFANSGWLTRAIQIDHTYMFVPEVLESFVHAAGFEIISSESHEKKAAAQIRELKSAGFPPYHAIILAEKSDRTPFAHPSAIKPLYPAIHDSLRAVPTKRWKHLQYQFHKTRKRLRHALIRRY